MSRGPYPLLLVLAMALPGAVRALGLGDIRVDSGLNEPLSAQIEIVGATRDELAALTAKVANHEIFQRYGADRPAFLSTATFKVGVDERGRAVLNVRSADAFTDPLVSFLVDLSWGRNEIVREYSLLLDPPGLARQETALAAARPEPLRTAQGDTVAQNDANGHGAGAPTTVNSDRIAAEHSRHKVVAGDTLRGIARHAGAQSESQIQRTMIAIFRANPGAFGGNINWLHGGAVLILPTAEAVDAVSGSDARREVRAHMTAWRQDSRPDASHRIASSQVVKGAVNAPAAQNAAPAGSVPTTTIDTDAALNTRVQSLEHALDDMHEQLANQTAKIQNLNQAAAAAVAQAAAASVARSDTASPTVAATVARATAPPKVATTPPSVVHDTALFGPVAAALALLVAGFAYLRTRLTRTPADPADTLDPMVAASSQLGAHAAVPAMAAARIADAPRAADATQVGAKSAVLEPSPRFEPSMSVKPAMPALADQPTRVPSDATTTGLEIDIEALERSYLDSLGAEPSIAAATGETAAVATAAVDTAADTSAGETVAIDASEFDTLLLKADLNTAILDIPKLDTGAINNMTLDYDLLDLDATSQHVHMPSGLNDHAQPHERRTSIVDVLKTAIARDPHRRDLRMKLIETYYGMAAVNKHEFMESARTLARERDYLSAEDWAKVVKMGKEIAADDALFADAEKDDPLANCA